MSSAQQQPQTAKDVVQPHAAQARATLLRRLPSGAALKGFLRRLNTMLSTLSGMDRVFMLIQYSAPLVALLLRKSTTFPLAQRIAQTSSSKPGVRRTSLAASLLVISAKLSEWRTIGRFFGLLPIISWAISLANDQTAPKNPKLRAIQRLQALSMLVYYPLEHAYYLASHGIISMSAQKQLRSILWACRAWALYVFLQLIHLSEEARVLSKKMATITEKRRKDKLASKPAAQGYSVQAKEKDAGQASTTEVLQDASNVAEEAAVIMNERECFEQSKILVNSVMTNLAYAPLTVHWSLERGIFTNGIWSSVFGTMAAISSLQAVWRSTA